MKIIVLEKTAWVFCLDNSVVSCSFFVLQAASPDAVGLPCASQNWCATAVSSACSWTWLCRYDASNKRALHEVDLEVVIILSDTEDDTAGGERRKTAAVCQCIREKRTSGIVPEGTAKSFDQVLGQVHGLMFR
jgi:hypothetical protein